MPVYLLHFDRPYRHARHYMGYAWNLESMHARIDRHYAATPGDGHHHRLIQVIRAAGISFTLARVWETATPEDERRMKCRGHARRCPLCREERSHVGR
jgi:hypothetical protein